VLVCTNIDGCEKMWLLITGKSEKPRRFKYVKSVPCTYIYTYITSVCVLYMEFLTCLERIMAVKNWKILLFVDHFAADPKETNKIRMPFRKSFLRMTQAGTVFWSFLPGINTTNTSPSKFWITMCSRTYFL
jgi:hypothetical protein